MNDSIVPMRKLRNMFKLDIFNARSIMDLEWCKGRINLPPLVVR